MQRGQAADGVPVALNPPLVYLPMYLVMFGAFTAVLIKVSMHQIPEGYVGTYWRGGKLLSRVSDAGIHFRVPLLDSYEVIQVTMQTDKVTDILCGTKGGVNIVFEKIEVVNRLKRDYVYETIKEYGVHYDRTWIYDKIHHEINQFCSSHSLQEVYIDKFDQVDEKIKEALQNDCNKYAPGIEIISVRVTKPRIPDAIMNNYVAMEVERTKVLVALEQQRVVEKEVATEKLRALAQAEKLAETSRIVMQQQLAEKEAEKRQRLIEVDIELARHRAEADAEFYRLEQEARGLRMKLTPQFLEYWFIGALANNTKLFFGEKLPHLMWDQRLIAQTFRSRESEEEQDTDQRLS